MNRARVTRKLKGLSSPEDNLHPLRYGANGALAFRGEADYSHSSEYDDDDDDVGDDDDDIGVEYDDEFSDEYQDLADLLDSRNSYRYEGEY